MERRAFLKGLTLSPLALLESGKTNMGINSPVPVKVTRLVSRIQPFNPPFLIINQNLTATVWASSNQAVQPGYGTPVSPGTAITWTADGDLYLILGNDTASLLAASADVIVSYDVADWQAAPSAVAAAILNAGVLVIDNPKTLINLAAYTGGTLGNPHDVSKYNSLQARFQVNASSAFPLIVNISWYADSGLTQYIRSDYLYFRSLTIWSGEIPCRAAYCTVSLFNGGTYTVAIQLIASNRVVPGIQQDHNFNLSTMLRVTDVAVAGGGFGSIHTVPPYIGELEIRGTTSVALTTSPTSFFYMTYVDGTIQNRLYFPQQASAGNGIQIFQRIYCNGGQLTFQAANSSGIAADFGLEVIAIV